MRLDYKVVLLMKRFHIETGMNKDLPVKILNRADYKVLKTNFTDVFSQ